MAQVFPGDEIVYETKDTIRLSTGVDFQINSDNYIARRCGVLRRDGYAGSSSARPILWVQSKSTRYDPQVNDLIIVTIVEKNPENYKVDLGNGQTALLSTIAFDGATRHNRPMLDVGMLVYCRVAIVNKYLEPELSCCALVNKRDWVTGESIFGELKGGMSVQLSLQLVHSFMDDATAQDEDNVLNILGSKLKFEIAIGVNGVVWLNSESLRHTIVLMNVLKKYDQDRNIDVRGLADRALKILVQSPGQ